MGCPMCDSNLHIVEERDCLRCEACGWTATWGEAHRLPVDVQDAMFEAWT
jgi:hypothetical protein